MTLPIGTKIPLYAEGNATENDVLEGKTFSTDKGNNLKGSIPNMGVKVLEPKSFNQELGNGYYDKVKIKGINDLDETKCKNIIDTLKNKFPNIAGKKFASGKITKQHGKVKITDFNFTPSIIAILQNGDKSYQCCLAFKTKHGYFITRSEWFEGCFTHSDNEFIMSDNTVGYGYFILSDIDSKNEYEWYVWE
ncbi:hypothetical protein G8S49_05965 [Clostridium botulinum C]|uniref:Uncharacterized protein n=1 Tax=Clostridium botulinum C TaxID=36828 RepID=A0A9Q3V9X0_CLOBO|nr:hypothetical protein [Clostridium botulinum]MCD3194822.1 hypothetical protein [Clostridium botulinum C]MCD3200243.1 hypothetical protein [Clostridium botulinum C]MCD3205690.1 hypothetical protein [Clostridium botulinum C]MCD3207475.1 hypothetical protein [Clostridium botulinum C]MCD3226209.1 hypothetical protein [Clostridium botulinum C]